MYINEIIAYGPNTVKARAAKRKPPKGGYHAQIRQKEEISMLLRATDTQHFILNSPLLRIPFSHPARMLNC